MLALSLLSEAEIQQQSVRFSRNRRRRILKALWVVAPQKVIFSGYATENTFARLSVSLVATPQKVLTLVAKSPSKLGFLLAYSVSLVAAPQKILSLAVKSSSKLGFLLAYQYFCPPKYEKTYFTSVYTACPVCGKHTSPATHHQRLCERRSSRGDNDRGYGI